MRHFDRIGLIDVGPVLKLLPAYEPLWRVSTFRQDTEGTPHKDTQAIFLRMPAVVRLETIFDDLGVIDWPVMIEPIFTDLVNGVARLAYAEPARAMLAKLLPGGVITEHIDQGDYADATDRYHLCITTNPQSEMRIANEVVFAKPEEVWWFDKTAPHSCRNDGDTPRIHLIVDCWRD